MFVVYNLNGTIEQKYVRATDVAYTVDWNKVLMLSAHTSNTELDRTVESIK